MSRWLRSFGVASLSLAAAGFLLHCSGGDDAASPSPGDAAAADGQGDGQTGDAGGTSTDGASDVAAPPRCDPKKPFGTPMMVLESSFLIDQSARLSPDELTLYYAGYGHDGVNGQSDLWVATRTSTSVPFKDPKRIDELSTTENELYPTVTADGRTIYYDGWLPDAGYGVITATRPSLSAPFGGQTLLPGVDLTMVYVTPDGARLYGSKNVSASNADIFSVSLPTDGGPAEQVQGVGGGTYDYWPVVSADGLSLYYAFPLVNPYQWEIEMATRATTSEAFKDGGLVTELDTPADEHPTFLSPDGCTLYFQRVNASITGNASGLLAATRGL